MGSARENGWINLKKTIYRSIHWKKYRPLFSSISQLVTTNWWYSESKIQPRYNTNQYINRYTNQYFCEATYLDGIAKNKVLLLKGDGSRWMANEHVRAADTPFPVRRYAPIIESKIGLRGRERVKNIRTVERALRVCTVSTLFRSKLFGNSNRPPALLWLCANCPALACCVVIVYLFNFFFFVSPYLNERLRL